MHGRLSTLAHNLAIAGGLQRAWNLAADYFVFDEGRWVTWVPGCGLPTERYPMRRSEP